MAIDFGVGNDQRYYSVPHNALLDFPSGDWTFAELHYITNVNGESAMVATKGPLGAGGFRMTIADILSSGSGVISNFGGVARSWSGGDVNDNEWYWVYAARRGDNMFVGAVNIGNTHSSESVASSIAAANANNTDPLLFGVDNPSGGSFVNGRMDRMFFADGYGATLPEMQTLATGTLPENASFASSIAVNFNFTNASAATIIDSVGGLIATRNGTGWGPNQTSPYGAPSSVVKGIIVPMPVVSKTGLHAAFFDQPLPSAFTAPTFKTATATIDSNGLLELDIDAGTALDVGGTGHVIVYELNGTDHKLSSVFSGQVNVIDIA